MPDRSKVGARQNAVPGPPCWDLGVELTNTHRVVASIKQKKKTSDYDVLGCDTAKSYK
jgi:hypothetical protein